MFGLSIISIILHHFFEDVRNYTSSGAMYNIADIHHIIIGAIGVDVFVFLSGMGLYFSMKKNSNIRIFYFRRFKRLAVPYLMIGGIFWIIRDIFILKYSAQQFLLDLTTLSFWMQGVGIVWFVSFISVMYLLYPAIFKIFDRENQKSKFAFFVLLMMIWLALIGLLYLKFGNVFSNIHNALWRVPIFIFGAYIAEKIYKKEKFDFWVYILLALSALIKIVYIIFYYIGVESAKSIMLNRMVSELFTPAMIFIVFLLLIFVHSRIRKLLADIGSISLELYVSHVTIRAIMLSLNIETWIWYNYCICIILSVLISVIVNIIQKKIFKPEINNNRK